MRFCIGLKKHVFLFGNHVFSPICIHRPPGAPPFRWFKFIFVRCDLVFRTFAFFRCYFVVFCLGFFRCYFVVFCLFFVLQYNVSRKHKIRLKYLPIGESPTALWGWKRVEAPLYCEGEKGESPTVLWGWKKKVKAPLYWDYLLFCFVRFGWVWSFV